MAYFKESKTKATVKVLERCMPEIMINADAVDKMQLYVANSTDEVGWLGTAYKQGNVIKIVDMYLFDQEVHSTTTEITPEGLSTFGEAILANPNGMEIWNNLKVWGHSHVNMPTGPSGQDDNQMEFFATTGHDWFVRIIANKSGSLRVDLYDYEHGIIWSDLPWDEVISPDEEKITQAIFDLELQLETYQKNRLAHYETAIKTELLLKVKKKQQLPLTTIPKTLTKGTNVGNHQHNKQSGTTSTTVTQTIKPNKSWDELDEKAWKLRKDAETKINQRRKGDSSFGNIFTDDQSIVEILDQDILLEIGECTTLIEVERTLVGFGYYNYFNQRDLGLVWDFGKRYLFAIYSGKEMK